MTEQFSWPVRVYYEDTDAGGIVYYGNYLKFMERARTEWLRYLGFDQQRLMQDENIAFTIVSADIRYIVAARLDDQLLADVRLTRLRRASMEIEQSLYYVDNSHHSRVELSTAAVRVACVDSRQFKPCALPDTMLNAFKSCLKTP